jgi:hypothetical protein
MKGHITMLRVAGAVGAFFGYGCLIAFLSLVSMQIYRWFRDGEWTHIGMSDGMRDTLARCCVKDPDSGSVAAHFVQWLDSPVDWLGLHRVFEVIPASLALFLVSIAGNCLFIYSRDRLHQDAH